MFSSDYHYTLPPERIAHAAAEPRDSAKMLFVDETGGMQDKVFKDILTLVRPHDIVVVNASKVIPARLHLVRLARGADGSDVSVEILLHRNLGSPARWLAFVRPGRRIKEGDRLCQIESQTPILDVMAKHEDGQIEVQFLIPDGEISRFLEGEGETPLPPYIHTDDSAAVRARYQTVYAKTGAEGSVAAPTAGLHFTPEILSRLNVAEVCLHVGAGTFLSPTPEQVAAKRLHAEWVEMPAATAARILEAKKAGGRVICVGTTSLRSVESWARFSHMSEDGWTGDTQLFISPGDGFLVTDALVTNFHLPDSSLLMLVAAFVGLERMHAIYEHAMALGYRFYSFGDSSFLERKI
ncbi:MAG: tRNA preQ1(34) S-adenosylmethionine ribosyltransferase-isomerase QueA [Alphaproteobacteria bacterium CG_4_10_14_0_8_um_filter_53_9]|nr:MAG: tRNA preQ1(34) S-adenosylmethionine ribosyltransferase-isomerase QueA [Alphaproteobacteria bacterium CG_4_10_14_0_8_um_filter_53_9]